GRAADWSRRTARLHEGGLDGGDDVGRTLAGSQEDADDRDVAVIEHLRVAGGLGRDELAERELASGHGEVAVRSVGDLDEHPVRRTTLVELPGRVQKAWSPAERHRAAEGGREPSPDGGEVGVRPPV